MGADVVTFGGVLLATVGAAAILLRWLLARAGAAIDEMIKQDYDSFAERLGDMLIWCASRLTPVPKLYLEEWLSHMCAKRAATGRPSLPEALFILATARQVSHTGMQPALTPPQTQEPDAAFGDTVLDQIFSHWVEPELARRGLPVDRAGVRSAVVVMAPGAEHARVLLDDETQWVARMRAKRAIEAGEAVTSEDVEADSVSNLRPENLNPNAAWTGFVTVGSARWIAFDFRRNRKTASDILSQAQTEHELGSRLLRRRSRRLAIGHLHTAADAAVVAQQLLHDDDPIADPAERARQFRAFVQLGNAPTEHSSCLDRLVELQRQRSLRTWLRPPRHPTARSCQATS